MTDRNGDQVRAVIIPVEGDMIRRTIDRSGLLSAAQTVVGGWIEGVVLGEEATLYCNEEGKLQGMPLNPRATALCKAHKAIPGDHICGSAIVLGPANQDGDEQHAPDVLWDSAIDPDPQPQVP